MPECLGHCFRCRNCCCSCRAIKIEAAELLSHACRDSGLASQDSGWEWEWDWEGEWEEIGPVCLAVGTSFLGSFVSCLFVRPASFPVALFAACGALFCFCCVRVATIKVTPRN